MIYYDGSKKKITVKKELGKGGEATVFLTANNKVLKIYHGDTLDSLKKKKIELLIGKNLRCEGICFPEEIAYNEKGTFAGYIMPKADGIELQYSIFGPMLIQEEFPNWSRVELAKLAISILKKIDYLHGHNIIIGDINPLNILVKDCEDVYFVDTDSYQVDNIPCPVGTPYFTAPEIQGKNYKDFIRTTEHEYFAVATLLFMIFLPGKAPYSCQGGESPAENIKNGNFSYPLGDDDNFLTPQGMWEYIWLELTFDLKKAFYEVFKEKNRITIATWLELVEYYQKELEGDFCSKDILPKATKTLLENRSLNLNRRNVSDRNKTLRIARTVLNKQNIDEKNFAVLELSTKAVKLLMGNHEALKKNGFSFEYFTRNASKTETGNGLNQNNYMNMNYFDKFVMPQIEKMVRTAKEYNISILYGVATAAYRSATNREAVIEHIREKARININILTQHEEAMATLTAFGFSKPKQIVFRPDDYILMIDQGGGSTEISLFNGKYELVDSYSVNLGSTVLKTILFKEATGITTLEKAFKDSEKLVQLRLRTLFNSSKSKFIHERKNISCVSVGTAITNATGKTGNPKQHGTVLTYDEIVKKIEEIDTYLKTKYTNINDYKHALNNKRNSYEKKISDELDNLAVMRVGLPMYKNIMEALHIKEIIVSGTGLWYGVFVEYLYNMHAVVSNKTSSTF